MKKEVKAQAKVAVPVDAFWKALSKDLKSIIPKVIPNLVKEVQVIEGDGGLLLFNFGCDVPSMTYQKEKLVELDESAHRIGLEVIEGGHLNLGFSHYKTTFQLTAIQGLETLVDVTVEYESETEETVMPSRTTGSALALIKCLENYLLNLAS